MLSALSPARRRLVLAALALVVVAALVILGAVLRSDSGAPVVAQDRPGPVLLVPGYGGSTQALQVLAGKLRQSGRDAQVVAPPGEGTGDLTAQARALAGAAAAAVSRTGAGSVDVVGYSAGGVVARVWVTQLGGAQLVRRVLTLGSPHHGTEIAALAGDVAPSLCPTACQQLDPDSALLRTLNAPRGNPAGPSFVSIWSTVDEVVTPPDSAALPGALNLPVQSVCAASQVAHGELPTDRVIGNIVILELGPGSPRALTPSDCPALSG